LSRRGWTTLSGRFSRAGRIRFCALRTGRRSFGSREDGSFFLCGRIVVNDWAALFIYGAISFAVPNLLCFLVYRKNPLFRESVRQVLRIFHRK
jgi:hypothetical protein